MNPSSRRPPRPQPPAQRASAARYLPAFAATAVVGAVVIAGAAGGLGGDGDAKPPTPSATAPATVGLPPSTQAIVIESTEAPVNTTSLSQPVAYGSAGESVRDVQERLDELGFFVGPIDGQFGNLTKMAVWAFEKLVLQVPRDEATGVVTDEMWQVMQQPLRVEPRRKAANGAATRNHTEIYLPEQVVVFFRNDEAALISHMSSGTGEEWKEEVTIDVGEYGNENGTEPIVRGEIGVSHTPGGVFDYDRMIDGVRQSALGGMWDPAYFNYGIAIHGAMNVPQHPASHGCIRVPLKVGEMFHDLIDIGDRVFVWDGVEEPEYYANRPDQAYPRGQLPIFNRIDPDYSTTTTSTTTLPPATTATTARPQQTEPAATQPQQTQPPATTPPPPAPTPAATTTSTTTTTTVAATTTTVATPG